MADLNNSELSRKPRRHMSMQTKRTVTNTFIYILLVIISIIWIAPFIFLVLQSFDVASKGLTGNIWPDKWGIDNYAYLFSSDCDFLRWYFNTFIIALCVAIGQTAMQIMMAYALSRFRFKLRKTLMNMMLILGMFPGFLTMIVLYEVLNSFNMVGDNAVPGLIIVSIASSGMGYYVVKGFLDTMPKSLDEAAMVDGANRFQVFYKVILPLCKPIVIYTILTSFMGPWGDYIFAAAIAKTSSSGMNVAAGLSFLLNSGPDYYKYFCAGGVLVAIPVVILFLFLQKYYVEGVTGGAVKG